MPDAMGLHDTIEASDCRIAKNKNDRCYAGSRWKKIREGRMEGISFGDREYDEHVVPSSAYFPSLRKSGEWKV